MSAQPYGQPELRAQRPDRVPPLRWSDGVAFEELPVGGTAFVGADSVFDHGNARPASNYVAYNIQRAHESRALEELIFRRLPPAVQEELGEWVYGAPAGRFGAYNMYPPGYPIALLSEAAGSGQRLKGAVLHREARWAPHGVDYAVVWFEGVKVGHDSRGRPIKQRLFPLADLPEYREVEIPGPDGNVGIRVTRASQGEVVIERPGAIGQGPHSDGRRQPAMYVRYSRRRSDLRWDRIMKPAGWLATNAALFLSTLFDGGR